MLRPPLSSCFGSLNVRSAGLKSRGRMTLLAADDMASDEDDVSVAMESVLTNVL